MPVARPDLSTATWRKSTHSENDGGCVEIAEQYPDVLPIRDSKAPGRTPIVVRRAVWHVRGRSGRRERRLTAPGAQTRGAAWCFLGHPSRLGPFGPKEAGYGEGGGRAGVRCRVRAGGAHALAGTLGVRAGRLRGTTTPKLPAIQPSTTTGAPRATAAPADSRLAPPLPAARRRTRRRGPAPPPPRP
ncbi:DUF397 domain-containing protein [Streptomyces sp. AV19]|uniref:DUF397 domain-containing protein n=1 Tax=Streptomyces sp. AV19 TaxID=2793068 RepID=UPI0018FED837|nr:DUF397 domain-containing protein [Streptomyces sp. AV19]MBH1933921.1 DUF397 domain-containing protein [Streptomyces sp. AV19]MDG4535595.1 DUF397 domain-containing protein [Streptomyces sp. AV19]